MVTALKPSVRLTGTSRARLEAELDRLQGERLLLLAFIDRARAIPAYDPIDLLALRDQLAWLERRIAEAERDLARDGEAAPPSATAGIGASVTVRDSTGAIRTYVIVHPLEADPSRGQIAFDSPVGAALFGRRAGDEVRVAVPAGVRSFTVLSIA